MTDIALAQLFTAACNAFRREQMGIYAHGPFTPVQFLRRRNEIVIHRSPVQPRSSLVATIRSEF